jgi:hypothetical protein
MRNRLARIAAGLRPAGAAEAAPRLHVEIVSPKAKVLLLPGHFRSAEHIKRHVAYVLTRDAEQGEQHIHRNLRAIRRTLQELGVDQEAIENEVRRIEGAVRAELWRQVLLPGGDQ